MLGRLGVRSRIVAGSVAVVVIVVSILLAVLWRATTEALQATAYDDAVATLRTISERLRSQPPEQALPVDRQPSAIRAQQVLGADGTILAYSREAARTRQIADIQPLPGIGEIRTDTFSDVDALGDGNILVASTRVRGHDGRTLTVLVAVPTSIQPAAAQRLFLVGLLVMVASLTVLFLVLRYAVGLALHPVDVMRRELEAINTNRDERTVTAPDRSDEIGRLGLAINELLARLRRSDAERAMFVSDAGHELRSPLSTVSVSLELLGSDLTPERRAIVTERASGELTRLSTLVEDLLSLAKSDETSELVGATDLDLDDLVLEEVAVARSKGGTLSVALEPVRVTGVQEQVQRVIRNLVENAMRHATSQVRLRVRHAGDHAVLTVDNDGTPVAPDDRERIFHRFVRLDQARDRDSGGSGLGLAIVRELVRRHGGTVTSSEAPDGWCRFTVRLPAAQEADQPVPARVPV